MEQPSLPIRESLASARSVVIKIGTAALTGGTRAPDREWMHDIATTIAALNKKGRRVIVVSSGAIGTGVGVLKLKSKPTDVPTLQAAAAAGQPRLMNLWAEALHVRRLAPGQILLSRADFDSRERFLNIRNCVTALLELGAVPIVNENDTVATEEIALGDNDVLAAKVAVAVQAEALVILTTTGGVLDHEKQIIPYAARAEDLLPFIREEKSAQGRGGMKTKVEAARIATAGGVATVIAPGRPVDSLARVLTGEAIGTCVLPIAGKPGVAGRRGWIALAATPLGSIDVDDGAAKAIRDRGASLLAKGIVSVTGRFEVGDVVQVRDTAGHELARGLTNLADHELRAVIGKNSSRFESILGRRAHAEVIHRDNMTVKR